ncbi:hypothetical protein A0R60_0480 [Enterobacter asburiae]|nr:hypothetical protein A0R60_0480 [Enterobacter asburiae]
MGRAGEDVAAIKFRMKPVGGSNKQCSQLAGYCEHFLLR